VLAAFRVVDVGLVILTYKIDRIKK